jgi:hypothetical protein
MRARAFFARPSDPNESDVQRVADWYEFTRPRLERLERRVRNRGLVAYSGTAAHPPGPLSTADEIAAKDWRSEHRREKPHEQSRHAPCFLTDESRARR